MIAQGKILIIDDEEIVLDSCREILEVGGYAVATATDGTLGLQQVKEVQPDLVYVDLKMPGLSGFEVLERIRALDPSIVMIVITGYATLNSAVEAMQKGAYDFVPKPFTPEELRLITQRGLEKRRLVLEAAALRREQELLREHFASIVSHELKAPLAAVQQNLMLLAHEPSGALTEGQRARLERMQSRLNDLLKMIDTWLRVISVDVARIKESFRPTSVALCINKAVETVQTFAARKDVAIATSIEELLRPVSGDEGSLTEALVNVLSNAVKYSYPGGKVSLAAREQDGRILIAVSDAGVGIPPDDLPHVFEDFYRGKGGPSEEGGVGLGLAITRRIVETHHGAITAESTPGKGSTFTISLPAITAETETRASPDEHLQQAPS